MNGKPEKVLVTGSSGLIGSQVVRRLAGAYDVIGFDRDEPAHPVQGTQHIDVDVTSGESVRNGLETVRQQHGGRIASVIHLAAYYDFSGEPSPLYEEVTVQGTERLLTGLKLGFQVQQFIFSSTLLVHAPCQPGQRIDENWPLEPKWDYPQSKVRTEELLRQRHDDIPLVLLRIAGVYDDECHSLPLARQMQRIYERHLTSQVFPGDTSCGQSFLHLEDLLNGLEALVERRQNLPSEVTLLLGEPETLSYEELQRTFGKLIHGEEWTTRQIPKTLARAGAWMQEKLPLVEDPFIKPWMIDLADDHYALDLNRAQTYLDWKPQRSLPQTLSAMVAALKADPLQWYHEHKLEPPAALEQQAAEAGKGSYAR